ncbi:hypothetical protein WA171_004024 [Blastocystis sp. BT1]
MGVDIPSTACSNMAKKWLKIQKLGHTGTLDSYAEGVLLLAIGRSTKLIPVIVWQGFINVVSLNIQILSFYVSIWNAFPKYRFWDTCINRLFSSSFEETGSRVKYLNIQQPNITDDEGVISFERVQIDSIELLEYLPGVFPEVTIEVHCHSGTYIRSLCRDVAKELGTSGVVTKLIRTESNGQSLDVSCSL